MSHDNWSKNHLVVLKFGTDVAFIYRQIEFVATKKSVYYDQRYLRLKNFIFKFSNRVFSEDT